MSVHYRADGPIAVITIDRPEVAKIAMPVSWPSSPRARVPVEPKCPRVAHRHRRALAGMPVVLEARRPD